MPTALHSSAFADLPEHELVARAAHGDHAAFEALMRRCNQQVFRIARGILRNDAEAEDAVQEAYVTAYRALGTFRSDAKFSTWLSRIVINESLARLRKHKRDRVVVPFAASGGEPDAIANAADDEAPLPEDFTLRSELRALIEKKIDELPLAFRTVFIMREVQDMGVDETAQCLGIPEATVRTRLFRAKALLRAALAGEIEVATPDAFGFAGERCDRIVAAVLGRIAST